MTEVIRGRTISLVPATRQPEHMSLLLRWRNSADWREYCTFRQETVNAEEFFAEMARDFAYDRWLQYMIVNHSGEMLGTIFAYQLDKERKSTCITVYMDELYRNGTAATHAFVLLFEFLFYTHPLQLESVYTNVYPNNTRSWKPLCKGGMCLETMTVSVNKKPKMRLVLHKRSLTERTKKLMRYVSGNN